MKNREDICVIVQARLGSQRIPKKMAKNFSDTTLLDIAIKKIKECNAFNISQFHISLWESELKDIAKKHEVNIFNRSETSANSEGTPMSTMYEWWNKLPYKYCILVNACNPFLKKETIDSFFESYANSEATGMFAVVEKKNYFWNEQSSLLTPLIEDVMNTKTVNPTYEAAHCLYASKMSDIGRGVWMGDFNIPGEIELYPISEFESLDIDYQWQFDMCEKLWSAV